MAESMAEEIGEDHLARPVGQGDYIVQPNDCMSSIADAHGFFWEKLWNLPENAELRLARKDPNVLLPGDRVAIPPLSAKKLECAIDASHCFRRIGVPERLRMHLLDSHGQPRKKLAYTLVVDDRIKLTGSTDDDGYLAEWIPARATFARLEFEMNELGQREVYNLEIGRLNPVGSVDGAAARLANLGFCVAGQNFRAALEEFQTSHELEATGELDLPTQDKLAETYGY